MSDLNLIRLVLGLLVGLVLLGVGASALQEEDPDALLKKADGLFAEKHYAEAAAEYRKLLAAAPKHAKAMHAVERAIVCFTRLDRHDEALDEAEAHVKRTAGTKEEPRAERLAGNLYLVAPHWGTRAGGKFHRGRWEQGVHVQSYRLDKKLALAHLERARGLFESLEGGTAASWTEAERTSWREERIDALFDLVSACASFNEYENDWSFWHEGGIERDDEAAAAAGSEDFEERHSRWELQRKRPIGLRLGTDGRPAFAKTPAAWSADLGDDEKILWLLKEVRDLDPSARKTLTARSWYRQAMLARTRFGMERVQHVASGFWEDGKHPLQEEIEAFKPWELKDAEALILAGGKLRVVALPPEWEPFAMLAKVWGELADAGLAPEARYAAALIRQGRQQYVEAIAAYEELRKVHPDSEWANNAGEQIGKIRNPEVALSDSGVQPPRVKAQVQLTHRNLDRIWLTARRVDVAAILEEIRDLEVDPDKGHPQFWSLSNWTFYLLHENRGRDRIARIVHDHLGTEIARWSADVKADPGLRYVKAGLEAPVAEPGAWLVTAYIGEPPEKDKSASGRAAVELGVSRSVLVLTDLAFVSKPAKDGQLFYVADAATGAPVAGAKIDALEVWSEWKPDRKRHEHHSARHQVATGDDGLAMIRRPGRPHGQYHALVTAPGGADGAPRMTWTGIAGWNIYQPSAAVSGPTAFVLTDRPVYRPAQVVRYKAWLRERKDGAFDVPSGAAVTVQIHDPRGNKAHEGTFTADGFGGVDGAFTLSDEAPLGVWQLRVEAGSYFGGGSFRVEEYKNPEFEVTVEPGATHAKLGGKIGAKITARYLFGAPVTDASVEYKVFREEYRASHFEPGPWDWLYGEGYGYAFYESPWFPWWGGGRFCPPWWWDGGRTPVRELVAQGKSRIGADGTALVEIDTAPALRDHPDKDHRYRIEAEVRDASRRTIAGEGAVAVTRQAFFAHLSAGSGWVRPGEEVTFSLRCLSPDGKPVKAEGVVTVAEVKWGGAENGEISETEIHRFNAATGDDGRAAFKLRPEKSGQWQVRFETPDAWGGSVKGHALLWVCGQDFQGEMHRFNDLELITDKRTYAPGETARVMVSTKVAGSHVLFSDDADNGTLLSWKLLRLSGRSLVVDVPIRAGHRPNLFLEASTLRDFRVHDQIRQVCVPPEEGVLDITVTADKPEYRPGEKCTLTVSATEPGGKPAAAQLVVAAFDRGLLQIQPETTPPIAKWFHGHLRDHREQTTTSVVDRFPAAGATKPPDSYLNPLPPGWHAGGQARGGPRGHWGDSQDRDGGVLDGYEGGIDRLQDLLAAGVEDKKAARGRAGAAAPASAPVAREEASRELAAGDDSRGFTAGKKLDQEQGDGAFRLGAEAPLVAATVRTRFADTAAWLASVTTGEDGKATVSFDMPENLTTWKIGVRGTTKATRVGEASTSAVTTKNFLVRLQAPRFFTEKDEVVLSANVHNYLAKGKKAKVALKLGDDRLGLAEGETLEREVLVEADGETRVDWRVKVLREGDTRVAVEGLTDEESDAMELPFPVLVHGALRQESKTGSMRPGETEKSATVTFRVPEERRPELTRLEVRFAPSLVGAMLDALPYCLDYPYGCTEQTMSRFLPAVMTLKTLQDLGVRLEDVKDIRGRLEEVRKVEKDRRRSTYAESPVFDSAELQRIVTSSLARIGSMQRGDGGWSWWSDGDSNPYLTGYVLWALGEAAAADVAVDAASVERGMNYLKNAMEAEMRRKEWAVSETWAFAAYVLSMKGVQAKIEPRKEDDRPGALVDRLWNGRDKLNAYGKSQLALALANLDDLERAKTGLRNVLQLVERNDETEVAFVRTPTAGWWHWWNNDIETNAWALRALMKLDPKSDLAPRIVKWLLENRRNGYYWRSTRDTTLCVAAMAEFVRASGEGQADYTLSLDLDGGRVTKQVKIDKASFFSGDSRFVVDAGALGAGEHELRISKSGPGALYWSTFFTCFTKEEPIAAAGLALKVDRTFFLLKQVPYETEVMGSEGQPVKEKRLRYERVPLKSGDAVDSGDLVQVELKLTSDNDYTYLCVEDPKPAGFEPVDVRSGGERQEGFGSYRELRDEKTVFFLDALGRGDHLMRYRLRAEVPGVFHTLPTQLFAMYAPELRANASELLIRCQARN